LGLKRHCSPPAGAQLSTATQLDAATDVSAGIAGGVIDGGVGLRGSTAAPALMGEGKSLPLTVYLLACSMNRLVSPSWVPGTDGKFGWARSRRNCAVA